MTPAVSNLQCWKSQHTGLGTLEKGEHRVTDHIQICCRARYVASWRWQMSEMNPENLWRVFIWLSLILIPHFSTAISETVQFCHSSGLEKAHWLTISELKADWIDQRFIFFFFSELIGYEIHTFPQGHPLKSSNNLFWIPLSAGHAKCLNSSFQS